MVASRRRGRAFPLLALVSALLLALPLTYADSWRLPAQAAEDFSVAELQVESAVEPLAVDTASPRFSWQLASTGRAVTQQSYQLRVAASEAELATDPLWDTGTVDSDRSVLVEYDGPALNPQTRYYWQVRATSDDGTDTGWSDPSFFETALPGPDAWPADWISAPDAATWSDFTVELDLTLTEGTALGVYLRSGSEGAYMWQLSDSEEGVPKLRPHKRDSGDLSVIDDVDLTAELAADVLKDRVTMRIELDGSTISTYVNGTLVDQRNDTSVTDGSVGLRTHGDEEAVVHAVSLTADGETKLDANLAEDANPFTGGTPVPGSGLLVSGTVDAMLNSPSDSPMLRDEITVPRPVASARLYASALGVYEVSLNGERVGDHELAPGWTDYDIRTQYQTYDVTDLLRTGDNALGILAGPGWYSGHLGWFGTEQYGSTPAVSAFLDVEYADGSRDTFATDNSWRSAPSPIVYSDLLMGETYDAHLEQPGWDEPGFDDARWTNAVTSTTDATSTLVPQVDPPVREIEELPARSVTQPEPDTWVFDLGQNMVGRVKLTISGKAGETVRLRHAEVTHPDGTIAPENLRSAKATDYYTFAEDGEIVYEPRFTFHGFRYVELTGLSVEPTTDAVTGVVLHTDSDLTSRLETSDPLVNQLQSNIVWSQRGNFLSIPTDTPARDERMGWTGDINVFAPTANFNMDTATFFTKWMADLRDAQLANGAYPEVAPQFCTDPDVHPSCGGGSTGWADAGITVPWTVWQSFGDTRIIEENYDSMSEYMDFLRAQAPDGIRSEVGSWGDWLNFDEPTSPALLGTAYYARSVDLMAQMAEVTGRADDAAEYRDLFEDIRATYIDEFIADDGAVEGDSQTAYVISIAFGLVPDDMLDAVGDKLVAALERRDVHLATGFLGLPSLLPGLSASGHHDVAYQLLLNRSYPSWGFQIDRGATTMWERWDSIMEDGSFGDLAMNSFNHFSYGAVGDWMYRNIGGISPLEPGYQKVSIAPKPGGGLTFADVAYDSVYGTIQSSWSMSPDGFALDVEIPANTTAVIELPASSEHAVLESGIPAIEAEGVSALTMADEVAVLEVGSGGYQFLVDHDWSTPEPPPTADSPAPEPTVTDDEPTLAPTDPGADPTDSGSASSDPGTGEPGSGAPGADENGLPSTGSPVLAAAITALLLIGAGAAVTAIRRRKVTA